MPPPRSYFPLSVLLLFPLFITTSTSSQTDHAGVPPSKSFAAQHTMGQHLKSRGIPNFGQATPMLYRGGQPSAEGFEKLARMGIDIVVDTGRSKRDETHDDRSLSHGTTRLDCERSHARDARIWLPGRASFDVPRPGGIREELSPALAERTRV